MLTTRIPRVLKRGPRVFVAVLLLTTRSASSRYASSEQAAPPCDTKTIEYSASHKNKVSIPQGESSLTYDIGVVGGGIIGLAVAREFKLRYPNHSIVLMEKEAKLAAAQSGHNSGVIHAGMYYKPGSMKARLCVEGARMTYEYCSKKRIPHKRIGKLIVAVEKNEIESLKEIYDRAIKNNVVDVAWLDSPEQIREVEPHCSGLCAVHCRSTGIVDWKQVAESFASDFTAMQGNVMLNHTVVDICLPNTKSNADDTIEIKMKEKQSVRVRHLVTCAGMYSDRMSVMTGGSSSPKMIPFRGEYLLLKKEKQNLVRGNIYPVPNPAFPFLGVHFTPRMNGEVWLGPNAILGFSREGYSYSDINWAELLEILSFKGMLLVALRHGFYGFHEMYKSLVISAQVKVLQKYVPDVKVEDVTRGPSGVRAQAVNSDGSLVEDFVFDESQTGILHVRNAPSPGATSSLAIGRVIVDKAEHLFSLNQ